VCAYQSDIEVVNRAAMLSSASVKGRRVAWRRETLLPYLLVAPAALLLAAIFVYPTIENGWLSLWSWKLTAPDRRSFVGLGNYYDLFFEDAVFQRSIVFTFLYTVVTLVASLVIGLVSAVLLHPVNMRRRVLVALLLLPYVISPVAAGLGWGLIWIREYGLANYLVGLVFGIAPLSWLADATLATIAVMITEIWRTTPFVTLILLAGLAGIPDELYEAASLDGATPWRSFVHVTLPLLIPSISVVVVFETIFKLRVFDLLVTLTGGGPGVATHSIGLVLYRLYFRYFDGGHAAATGMVLLLIGGAFALIYLRTVRQDVRDA
jgi:multiple sugar transport system permease protein